MKFLFFFFLLLGCNQDQVDCTLKGNHCHKANPTPSEEDMITDAQKVELLNLKDSIKTWALSCEGGIACGENDSLVPESGDSMLWAGLLCLSGEKNQCSAAKASQDSTTGQLYRSPAGSRGTNDSSRDMLLGFLSYLTASKDKDAATLLLRYIENNDYKLCSNATDNRCNVGTSHKSIWGTMKGVWLSIGLNPTSDMNKGEVGSGTLANLESQFASEGYPLHLVGVEILLKQETDRFSTGLGQAANNLLRKEPNNPFFEYLAKGKTARAAQLVLEKCPKDSNHVRKQWAWQRTESEQAWLQSKGWDCTFLANILTR